jgi:hypothetical protein
MTPSAWTADERELWQRLEAFELDDADAAYPWSQRLARENGWSHPLALRVAAEYKRFLFLACAAGHPVTPSEEVDAAWHLHLLYTRSYWEELCPEVLGRPLHHGPTRGGRQEGEKFHDWYQRTLESYRRFFGEPPADIWPKAEERFAPPHEQGLEVEPRTKSSQPDSRSFQVGLLVTALVTLGWLALTPFHGPLLGWAKAQVLGLAAGWWLVGALLVGVLAWRGRRRARPTAAAAVATSHPGSGCAVGCGSTGSSKDQGPSNDDSGCGASDGGGSGCGASSCGGSGCGGGGD